MSPYPIAASGYTNVILLLNMRRFVPDKDRQHFENLRGTETLHQAIQGWSKILQGQTTFTPLGGAHLSAQEMRAEDLMTPEEIGFATGVFRSIARERYFSTTYQVNKRDFSFPPALVENLQFKKLFLHAWSHWEIFLRPGMSGFFIIRLTRRYPQPRSLLEIVRETHRLQSPFDVPSALHWLERAHREHGNDPERLKRTEQSIQALLEWLGVHDHRALAEEPIYYPVHWRLAMEVINRFLETARFAIPTPHGAIHLQPSEITPSIPLHDLYILHHLDQLYVAPTIVGKEGHSNSKIEVSAQIIRESKLVRNGMVNLIEGSLLRPLDEAQQSKKAEDESSYEFPSPRWKLADELLERNLASWSDEFCILAPRVGILIPSQKYREGYELGVSTLPSPTLKVKYGRYWEAIERMVEFIFEARVLAQLIESDSYRLLQEMADELERVREDMYRGNVRVDETLKNQSIRAAHLMRLSALAQSLTHPFFWSRAEYAARKAQFLLEELDMPRIFEHIQHNIEGITSLASHVDEIYIADLTEKSNRRAAILSLLLAAASLVLVILMLPSFLQDWRQYCEACSAVLYHFYNVTGTLVGFALIVLSILILVKAIFHPTYRNPLRAIDELLR